MDISEQEESTFIQENLLSSNKELNEKTGELSKNNLSSKMELSKIKQSSKRELSAQNDDKSLISGLVPKGNSGFSQYSTSTSIYINTYCTGNVDGICKAILFELEQRVAKGEVKKPQGYVVTLIQRAHRGEFKPYLYEQFLATQAQSLSSKSVITT